MLQIRSEQMKVLEEAAWLSFEDEMVVHSRKFAPELCRVIGEEELRTALRRTMKRALGYGFTYRGPIRLCIELMFLFGSGFDDDPQYPMLGKILKAEGDQMDRAEEIGREVDGYLHKVSGPDNAYEARALRNFSIVARRPVSFSSGDIVEALVREMTEIYPQKAGYIGEKGLVALIAEGRNEAHKHGFNSIEGEAMMVRLMYGFGHGCTDDPLYPWISRTLKDDKITDPAARAGRLEKKALTWLDHIPA